MANLRYLALYQPRFVPPRPAQRQGSAAYRAFRDKVRRQQGQGEAISMGPVR
jgi:hypothetical protein